jgi:hypothetical protein
LQPWLDFTKLCPPSKNALANGKQMNQKESILPISNYHCFPIFAFELVPQ